MHVKRMRDRMTAGMRGALCAGGPLDPGAGGKKGKEMQLFNTTILAGTLAILSAMIAPVTQADAWNGKAVITFSGPVEIPGVHLTGWGILPAGTYVFKILDSQSNRRVVQIYNKAETTVYATILAIPNFRLKATDKPVMMFSERPAGQPEALRAWVYPGHNWGEEFVYPKARAMEIAMATNVPVLFTPAELPLEVSDQVNRADAPVVVEMKKARIMAVTPAGEEVRLAEVVTPPPVDEVRVATERPAATPAKGALAALPPTGSSVGMLALMGLLALAGAIALNAAPPRKVR